MTVERVNAHEIAYAWIHEHIGQIPRHVETFLSESHLATGSGCSRTPVREALARLETEGLIRRVPRKGAFVPAIGDSDVDAVVAARRVVEQWAVRRLDAAEPTLAAELDQILATQAATDDVVGFIDLDLRFHGRIVAAARNRLMDEFYASLRHRQSRMGIQILLADASRRRQVLREHRAIAAAIAAGEVAAATRAVDDHLDHTFESLGHLPEPPGAPCESP